MTSYLTWKAEDVICAVHGHYLHEQTWEAHGVSVDSRTVKPGDLFIALKGADQDGHDYVAAAFEAGAAAAIVSRPPPVSTQAPLITVTDTSRALEDLGQAGRKRSQARIIALTGSTDKTVYKNMLRLVLNEVGDTYTSGNTLTDHRDTPLSLAQLPETALYGIFDLNRTYHDGRAELSSQLRPDVAFIATAETDPAEYFSSREALADAKIFQGVKAGGAAVINRDHSQFPALAAAAKSHGIKNIPGFGRHSKAEARLLNYTENSNGSLIEASILGQKIKYSLGLRDLRIALQSLGSLCAAAVTGSDLHACAAALAHFRDDRERDMIRTIPLPDGQFTLIDESMDTNPATTRFAIRVLGQMTPELGGQRILVLGESATPVNALTQDIIEAKIAAVFTCGPEPHIYEALPLALRGFHTGTGSELVASLLKTVHPGDIITVKGGSADDMKTIIDELKALGNDGWRAKKLVG